MSRQRALLLAPLVVALLLGGWLLWARQDPARQGGYCSNATLEIAGSVGSSIDLSSGAGIPAQQILDRVTEVDVARFEVDTPPEIAEQVRLLREDRSKEAYARIIGDYLERCGSPG